MIENMRAKVKHRLGVAYDDVNAINPRIVYGSISGFGQDGPYGHRAGVDQIAQGMGGLMSITGAPGRGPMRVGIPIDDLTAGNLLALGFMMAPVRARAHRASAAGSHTSLLEAQVFMLDFQAARWLMAGEVAGQAGNDHPTGIPTGVFPDRRRAHQHRRRPRPACWARFCEAIGHPDWLDEAGMADAAGRSKDREAINAAIAEITATKPSACTGSSCSKRPAFPAARSTRSTRSSPIRRWHHLDMAKPMDHPRLGKQHIVGSAINMIGIDDSPRTATADAGAHTEEVLAWLGYPQDAIAALRAKHVV